MADPEHWHRRPGAPSSGPLLIFDLDGVISDAWHRQTYLTGEEWDWHGFFMASADDPPIPAGIALVGSVAEDHAIAILTARPSYVAEQTHEWLERHGVRHDIVITRPSGDRRPSATFKREELQRLQSNGYVVVFAIDDDRHIIDMYRSEGVFALYVHSGYYDR